jgi:alpha,alpha-trehalase
VPDNSKFQAHVNLAIAYNVYRYLDATGDRAFVGEYGAEMVIEIARYMADIAQFDDADGRYHIRGVLGPDEFHERYPGADEPGLNDNAYTNVMTAWLLRTAPGMLDQLDPNRAAELRDQLDVTTDTLNRWNDIARSLYVPFHGDGIISQFDGYGELEELDWDRLRDDHGDIGRLDRILEAEHDDINRYKAGKQADTLMLFYLLSADHLTDLLHGLGYDFDKQRIPQIVRYYLDRTSHGSTLSRVVHAWVLARSDREGSWQLFREALRTDIDDIQGGTTSEGIHLGAMAGTVDLLMRCYAGLEVRGSTLRFRPRVPKELGCLCFRMRFRSRDIDVVIDADRLELKPAAIDTPPLEVNVLGERFTLSDGSPVEADLRALRAKEPETTHANT